MVVPGTRWLERKPFNTQLIILVAIFDPLGAIGGYLLAPTFGVDPIMGVLYGLVAASIPLSLWVVRYANQQ